MSATLIAAMFFTVALLVTTAYFLMGSVPLLILKHDTPMDSRFVRGFYNTYYLAVMFTASATALSYAFSGWLAVAVGAAALALLATILRWKVIPKMDSLRAQIQVGERSAIAAFRRIPRSRIAFAEMRHLASTVATRQQLEVRPNPSFKRTCLRQAA